MFLRRLRYNTQRIVKHVRIYGCKNLWRAIKKRVKSKYYSFLNHLSLQDSKHQWNKLLPSQSSFNFNSLEYHYLLNTTEEIVQREEPNKITWIIPEFGPSSGGHRTIFRHIANLSELGISSTLAILEVGQSFSIERAYANLPSDLNLSSIKIVMAKNIGSIDKTFVVTSWHTAYWARGIAKNSSYYGYYFIQDNESMFYPSGSLSLLALETYKMQYKHIYASDWLAETLAIYSEDHVKRIVDLGVDRGEFSATNSVLQTRRNRILNNQMLEVGVYYRPVTARRMEEHLYLLLEYISKNELGLRLHFFGWDWSKHEWPIMSKWHANHGIVQHSELESLLNKLDCCILLGSTNVSLMPLETISAGLPTFVNHGKNNSCLLGDLPIYLSPLPDIGFKELSEFTKDRGMLINKMIQGINMTKSLSWEKQSKQLHGFLIETE
jgi:hypothetical protein